ncbi:hypothetical protein HAX54_029058 [Datura stramonium]|uniref:Uncharacterized protein n=1 Tax=Datura stramonium TaxID=4076 RepID=A0ABS8V8K8_DATST|nr:hypothetical protein [Datura stramonium]
MNMMENLQYANMLLWAILLMFGHLYMKEGNLHEREKIKQTVTPKEEQSSDISRKLLKIFPHGFCQVVEWWGIIKKWLTIKDNRIFVKAKENETIVANRYEVLGDDHGTESVTEKKEVKVKGEVCKVDREMDKIAYHDTILEVENTSQSESKFSKFGEINDQHSRREEENRMALVKVVIEDEVPIKNLSNHIDKETNMKHDGFVEERVRKEEEKKMELVEIVTEDTVPINTLSNYIDKETNGNKDGFAEESNNTTTQNNSSKLPNTILHELVTRRVADWKLGEKEILLIEDKDNNAKKMKHRTVEFHRNKDKHPPKINNRKRSKETNIAHPNRVVTRSATNKENFKF